MKLLRRSLAEDSADRLNHTWSVLLFLVLALITWLLPLSPIYQSVGEETATLPALPELPTYTANCWCPNQFTPSMVTYVNFQCAARFNSILNNNNDTTVYPLPDASAIPVSGQRQTAFDPTVTKETIENLKQSVEDKFAKANKQSSDSITSSKYFIAVRAPLILFILALGLKIPHLLWTVIASCSSLNIDQTLDTAIQGHSIDRQSRRELHRDLAAAVAASVKSSPCSNSKLYLIFKVLVVAVAVIELVYVGAAVLPDIDTQQTQLESFPTPSYEEDMRNEINQVARDIREYSRMTFLCDLSIRQLQTIQRYTVQCIFSDPTDGLRQLKDSPASSPMGANSGGGRQTARNLDFHVVVFTAALAYLIVLVVVDLLNLIVWIVRLLGSGRGYNVRKSLPMDATLVLALSQENAGPLVTRELAQGADWADGDDEKGAGEGTALHEEKM